MNKNDISEIKNNVKSAWNRLDKDDQSDVFGGVTGLALGITALVKVRKHYKAGDTGKALVWVGLWHGWAYNVASAAQQRRLVSLDKATKRAERSMYSTLRK